VKIEVGDLVTIVNYNTGKPYKKFYGLLSSIKDPASGDTFAFMDQREPDFLFYDCKIDWIVSPQYPRGTHNATYVYKYQND